MFEELRGLPPKTPKPQLSNKKRGCKTVGYGFLIVAIALIVGLVVMIPYFSNLGAIAEWNNLVKDITTEVNREDFAPNEITQQDQIDFETKLNQNITLNDGMIFDQNGTLLLANMNYQNVAMPSTLTLTNKDVACFLNSLIKASWLNEFSEVLEESDIKILEVNFTEENINGIVDASIVGVISSSSLGDSTDRLQSDKLPDNFYVKLEFSLNTLLNFKVEDANLIINKANAKESKVWNTLFGYDNEEDICFITAKYVSDQLNIFTGYWNANLVFNNNELVINFA